MRVGYFPYGAANPYQTLFYEAVAAAGVDVIALPVRTLFPLRDIEQVDIVHLDWLHPLYASRRGRLAGFIKASSAMHHLRGASRRQQPRLVHTVHNILTHDSYLSPSSERRVVARFLQAMDSLIGFSSPVFDALDREFDLPAQQSKHVVPHGHYIDSYTKPPEQSACRTQLGISPDVPVVLFFGGLRENKGILDLLQVFSAVHQKTGAELIVAGAGATPAVSQALSDADASVTVIQRHVQDDEVPSLFGAADIVALPFRSILNSGSAILAASMGRCVVMPDIASLHANLEPSAIELYSPNSPSALADALTRMLGRPRRHLLELGKQARAAAQENLCWSAIGRGMVQIYADLMP